MRTNKTRKGQARQRILDAVGRGFREHGYSGIGVDGLAHEAGLTSGAFYGHFPSKEKAFFFALEAGLHELHDKIIALQKDRGDGWIMDFIDFYLQDRRHCDPAQACALQSLSGEIERMSAPIRRLYQDKTAQIAATIASALPGDSPQQRQDKAWALLALLSGAVTLARAGLDKTRSDAIAHGARAMAIQLIQAPADAAAPGMAEGE